MILVCRTTLSFTSSTRHQKRHVDAYSIPVPSLCTVLSTLCMVSQSRTPDALLVCDILSAHSLRPLTRLVRSHASSAHTLRPLTRFVRSHASSAHTLRCRAHSVPPLVSDSRSRGRLDSQVTSSTRPMSSATQHKAQFDTVPHLFTPPEWLFTPKTWNPVRLSSGAHT